MDKLFDHKPTLGIHAIFEAAKNSSTFDRLMKTLFHIYSNSFIPHFIQEFLQCVAIALTNMDRHPSVENALEFAASYCIYHSSQMNENEDVLMLAVFGFIFEHHNRKLPAIRFRACEFVNRILNKMGPQASLDDDVFDKMAETMLERLMDKLPSVRAQAVLALQRLQDPPNERCRIIKGFMYHMEADPSCEVRARVVQNIAVTKRTLPLILDRLQDVKETVRKEAYRALTRLKPRKFTIRQRQMILVSGLSDRSDAVKNFVKGHVLPSWFRECSNNLIDFLSMLDVVSFKSETLISILEYLFSKYTPKEELISIIQELEAESNGKRVIPPNNMSPETAVLWASTVKYLGFDQCEQIILPELTQFAKYISRYTSERDMKNPDKQYILKQILEIANLYSFMDEMGRKRLVETCVDVMKDDRTGFEVVPEIIKLLEVLVPNPKERMIIIAELISDIREPLEETPSNGGDIDWEASDNLQKGDSKNSDERLTDDFGQLSSGSPSLDDCSRAERTDPETLIKCLTIIREMLKSPSVNRVDATLLSLKEHFILQCFKSDNGRVVSLAIDTLSLLCVWSLDLAKEFFIHFCIQITNDSVCVSAVEAVLDTLLVHGFEPFSYGCFPESGSDGEAIGIGEFIGEGSALDFTKDPTLTATARRIVPLVTSLLKSHMRELRCKVCEGLSKLLLSSRIDSPTVLAHLIILWFSKAADTEPLIRQPLGLFFSVFSSRRVGAPEIILMAFRPTLQGIVDLCDEDIDMAKVANLFVTLLRPDISSSVGKSGGEKGSYHGRLAMIILDEIRAEIIPLQILAKALSSLELDSRDEEISEKLMMHLQRTIKWLSRRCGEKRILNVIKKLKDEVGKLRDAYNAKLENNDANPIKEEDKENILDQKEFQNETIIPKDDLSVTKENSSPTSKSEVNNSDAEKNETKTRKRNPKESEVHEGKIENDLSDVSGAESTISVIDKGKKTNEITVVDESTVSESDFDKSESLVNHTKNGAEVQESESSEDILAPSPPKRRVLRSRTKNS